jgi:hypothetical protein
MSDDAEYILASADGILRARSWHLVDGERVPWIVYRVIMDGRQVSLWTRRRAAKRDLRRQLSERAQRRRVQRNPEAS